MATLKDKTSFMQSSITTFRSKPPKNQRMVSKFTRMKFQPRVNEMSLRIFQGKGK